MSISLKNHEDRIKALENKASSSSLKFTQLYYNMNHSTSIKFSQSLDNFDFVFFVGRNSNYAVRSYHAIPVNLLKSYSIPERKDTVICANAQDTFQGYITLNDFKVASANNMTLIAVWGLKIYYIFRYNIYKILKLISPILKF